MGSFSVKFWGVRGSIPAPGPKTAGYGGNTSCVEVRMGSELIILDMGSGLRNLGDALAGSPVRATFFLSHYHWDHIQGFPFFSPIFSPKNTFDIYGPTRLGRDAKSILAEQMAAPYFPVPFEIFRAKLSFAPIASGDSIQIREVRVSARELNHPNGVFAYRLDHPDGSLVYATDTEHGTRADDALAELAEGASALIYDGMYTPEEYRGLPGPTRTGWGHSTYEAGAAMVRRAKVKKLILFHHHPSRSDQALEEILARAQALHADTVLAREDEQLRLP
jgi:phosphoribosyl 1,2-cyclic phosphodiesterase